MTLEELVGEVEKHAIQTALKCADGNIAKAADALGMCRGTMYNKFEKYDIYPTTYLPAPKTEREQTSPRFPNLESTWVAHKTQLLLQALESCDWNRTRAAQQLGISLRCCRYLIALARDRGVEIPDNRSYNATKFRSDIVFEDTPMPARIQKELAINRERLKFVSSEDKRKYLKAAIEAGKRGKKWATGWNISALAEKTYKDFRRDMTTLGMKGRPPLGYNLQELLERCAHE